MESGVPYDILYCSSQDDEFPISELSHGPPLSSAGAGSVTSTLRSFKGWQSARNAEMPQVIVLRFPGNVELTQLRILNHEFKIASKVEVRLFALQGTEMEANPPSFRTIRFTKLGAVDFNSNEHSNYRSKERKTIHLCATVYFVKLLFNTPHHNAQNVFQQVGVYSIECSGKIISRVPHHFDTPLVNSECTPCRSHTEEPSGMSPECSGTRQQQQQHFASTPQQQMQKRGQLTSSPPLTPFGDIIPQGTDIPAFRSVRILEFEDFFIRRSEELLALKDQAVAIEDFDTAKECRDRINLMNKRSKRIYQLEQDKVQAIIEEDFDAAKETKRLMDSIMEKVYEDAKLPRPRPDFDPYNCISESVSDIFPGKKLQLAEEVEAAAAAARGGGGGGGGGGLVVSPVLGGNRGHYDVLEERKVCYYDNDDTANDNNNKNKKGKKNSIFSNISQDGDTAMPFISKYTQKMTEMVQELTDDIDDVDPPPRDNGADDNDNGDASLTLDETKMQPWERRVSQAILAAACEMEGPAELSADVKQKFEALRLSSCLGTFTTCCLFSKHFKLREAALNVLREQMIELYKAQPADIEETVLRFLDLNGHGLQDTIPNVVVAGCEFVRMVLADKHECLLLVLGPVVNLLPRLLCCAADANPRVRDEALTTLTLCIKTQSVTNPTILTALLADPTDKDRRRLPSSSTRVQVARLTVLEQLITIGRIGLRTLVNNIWTKLLQPCVNHHNREVRDLAVSIITHLVRERKLVLTEKRVGEIDNMVIRDQLKSILEQVKPLPVIAKNGTVTDAAAKGEESNKTSKESKKRKN